MNRARKRLKVLFRIEGVDYVVAPFVRDREGVRAHGLRFIKKDNLGQTLAEYVVVFDRARFVCECKGYIGWGHCKHADSMLAFLRLVNASLGEPVVV